MTGNPTQATPEMVEQVGQLPEVEMNPSTGEVRPLSPQSQADPSQQASQAGAAAETAGSPPEPQPQPPVAPAGAPQVPAQQVVEPQPQPAVTVVPGPEPTAQQPAPAPAPVEPAPAAEEPKVTPEEEAAAMERLDAFLKQQREEIAEDARRSVQSTFDKRAAQVDRQLQESQARAQELTQRIRELETHGLTEAERTQVLAKYAQDDERAQLDAQRVELLELHKSTFIESLLLEYRDYDVKQETLEAMENPEEMELYCEQQARASVEKKLAEIQPQQPPTEPAQPAATAAPAPAPQPVPAAQPQPNAPGVPAGAQAPSDVGSGGAPQEEGKFSTEQGADALQQNLKNIRWDRVNVRQA